MKKILAFVFALSSLIFVGYTQPDSFGVVVTADARQLAVEKIEASYNGSVRRGEEINKDDFEVVPYFRDNNSSLLVGSKLNSDEFSISPTSIEEDTGSVRIFYENVFTDVLITCSNRGQLIIKTDGLKAKLTVEAIKQTNDDDILNDGKDIIYTIQSEDKTDPVSEDLSNAIEYQKQSEKNLEVLKAYEIQIKKEVTGENSVNIDKTNEDIFITLNIPEEYRKENRVYWMAHEHNGAIELLKDLDNNKDTITIQTSSFSSYVLYCTEKRLEKNDDDKETIKDSERINPNKKETQHSNVPEFSEDESVFLPGIVNHVHDHITITKAPTCEDTGYRDITCKICASHERTVIPALGHEWNIKEKINQKFVECVRCGKIVILEDSAIEGFNFDIEESVSENSIFNANNIINQEKYVDAEEGNPIVYEQNKPEKEENFSYVFLLLGLVLLFLIILVLIIRFINEKQRRHRHN